MYYGARNGMVCTNRSWIAALLLAGFLGGLTAVAEEGMWLFNDFPFQCFRSTYGFQPSASDLERLRVASLRFSNGGSGAFVSRRGLILTNQHVGAQCIHHLSSDERDLRTDGFVASAPEQELSCPDLEVSQLLAIERVTARIREAETPEMNAGEAAAARRAAMARLEEECQRQEEVRCQVVTLFYGREYDLYRYRRYTDVRLAFAPEAHLASFGGDRDNFEYPRYALDFALFRAYEDGRPAETPHLRLDPEGIEEGEVAFVSGHPGSTERLRTLDQLIELRDVEYPYRLLRLGHQRDLLLAFSARGEEQARIAAGDLWETENDLKKLSARLSGLLDDGLTAGKARWEERFRSRVADRPDLVERYGNPWEDLRRAQELLRAVDPRLRVLEPDLYKAGRLPGIARHIVRMAAEEGKPDEQRLFEYRDAARPFIERLIYTPAPLYPDYETMKLGAYLRLLATQLGPAHPLVITILKDETPEAVAHRAVHQTRLREIEARKALVEAGAAGVAASDDPLVRLVREIDPWARALRRYWEQEVEGIETDASTRLAEAYFAVTGKSVYPDATRSLRLTYGHTAGYEEAGREIPWRTTFGGLLQRSAAKSGSPDYELTPALLRAREALDPDLPLNFVSTHDITGGSSGSPVVNRQMEVVGVVFDTNLYALANRFLYRPERSRAISLDVRAILATLRTIYPAAVTLAHELTGLDAAGRAQPAHPSSIASSAARPRGISKRSRVVQ